MESFESQGDDRNAAVPVSAPRDFTLNDLDQANHRIEALEEKLLETRGQLAQTRSNNEKLAVTIQQTRDQISALRDEVEKLTQPPAVYGTFTGFNDDGTVDIFASGRKMRVALHPGLDPGQIARGDEVVLNESFTVIGVRESDGQGEVVTVKEVLDERRVLVYGRADEERVVELAEALQDVKLRGGDALLFDLRSNLLTEKLSRQEAEELILEEVPDISYADVGGLDAQIEAITDAVELPYLHRALFNDYDLPAPKGILLYGPPGCGKTLIAKAVANSLSQKVAELTGNRNVRSYFLNIKGPELLNKYVGETERQIRVVFQRAREKAEEGVPVIVFFDEMDSLFRTRGTGISSDMESTIVPQLLAEIDGVESLRDVIVIGATNREDLIDPAILRPGRLDVKIKIERPDAEAAGQIFQRYLHTGLPVDVDTVRDLGGGDLQKALQVIIEEAVSHMYRIDDENRFLEVTYQGGDKEILYFKDFSSGAMIENIVRRAKKMAVKREIAKSGRGLRLDDLFVSIRQEFRENEDLPNTTNPDDWARISGKKGERIVFIRTLVNRDETDVKGGRSIQHVGTGQYL
ncbi:MAG TPA: proteasome ATPase [Acidimicrobiales bacterium]|nr:proteasome ATPase [Acidimicrobiales bacterium]